MAKTIIRMIPFKSFAEAASAMILLGEPIAILDDPKSGIHIITVYDDGVKVQHAWAVVIGDFTNTWEVRDTQQIRVCGQTHEIIQVAFERSAIPFFVRGEEYPVEDIKPHSFYSPQYHCIRHER